MPFKVRGRRPGLSLTIRRTPKAGPKKASGIHVASPNDSGIFLVITTDDNWIRERSTKMAGCQLEASLSREEEAALDRIIENARVIALGEMTHGAREILQARERLLRWLIRGRKVTVLVIEACFAATRRLNDHLVSGVGNATEALACTQYWSCVNRETLHLVKWIREHNASPDGQLRPVRVQGCDVQSIDGPKAELMRSLEDFVRTALVDAGVCGEAMAALDCLPTDRQLHATLGPLLEEATATNPDVDKIAKIQAQRSELMTGVCVAASQAVGRLRSIQATLPGDVSGENRFYFDRCVRLLEQSVAFHAPDGLALRDRFMAENVTAVMEHFAGERLALLMHNLHVMRAPLWLRGERFVSTGCDLATALGKDYKVIGSAFCQGSYLASAGEREDEADVAVAHHPKCSALEWHLNGFAEGEGARGLLIDLSPRDSKKKWPFPQGIEMRLGEAGSQGSYEETFLKQNPEAQYDGLIFLTEATPITVLPDYYVRALEKWGASRHMDDSMAAAEGSS
jgi:erythromycin esterase